MIRSVRVRPTVLATLLAFALVAAACDSTGATTTTTVTSSETTTAPDTSDTTEATEAAAVEGFTYNVGMIQDILRPNYWALNGPDGTIVMCWVFCPTKPALFRIVYPGIVVAPDAAAGLPEAAVPNGDVWTVAQPIRDDYTWSDGSLLTAGDIVFTFETVRDAGLGANWIANYPYTEDSSPRLLGVEAVDDFTVRYTFDAKPGAAIWPHQVGTAPIMPRAPWEAVVAEALQADDPALALYDSDALEVGDLSGGPVMYNGRVEGESVELVKNERYANQGFTHQFWDDGSYALNGELLYGEGSGDPTVEYTEGPYLERMVFSLYDDQAAAMSALVGGDIDYWFAPPLSPAIRRQGLEADNLAVTVNPPNGFQYLAFNLRESPGKFLGFRQAMAYFDKENLANNVLQGAFTPLYVMVPEGNEPWYDEETAQEIAGRYIGLSNDERLVAAYAALEADGFTWQTPAVFEEGALVIPGAGIIDPEGNPVPNLEMLTPPAALLPERHTAALWLEDWAESLGIPAEATTTEGFSIFSFVWPGVGSPPTFDMAILFWGLDDPAWPTFHESFFHTRNWAETNDGGNNSGYSNPEFDALADAMFTETDREVAFEQVWQMERMLADDLPYMLLYTAPVTEFYNTDLEYPFTQTLAGIQNLNGMPGLVDR